MHEKLWHFFPLSLCTFDCYEPLEADVENPHGKDESQASTGVRSESMASDSLQKRSYFFCGYQQGELLEVTTTKKANCKNTWRPLFPTFSVIFSAYLKSILSNPR